MAFPARLREDISECILPDVEFRLCDQEAPHLLFAEITIQRLLDQNIVLVCAWPSTCN
jgi:hypothetical protein